MSILNQKQAVNCNKKTNRKCNDNYKNQRKKKEKIEQKKKKKEKKKKPLQTQLITSQFRFTYVYNVIMGFHHHDHAYHVSNNIILLISPISKTFPLKYTKEVKVQRCDKM